MTASIPQPLLDHLTQLMGARPKAQAAGASGGCINQGAVIKVDGQRLFLKWNHDAPARLFELEARGLELLRSTEAIAVPKPLHWAEADGPIPAHLIMEHVAPPTTGFDREGFGRSFGRALATMHRQCAERYGLEDNNYIGTLTQSNTWTGTWLEFFKQERLMPQRDLAARTGRLRTKHLDKLDALLARLGELIPEDPGASLLHGDLWSGNYMIGAQGQPVIIDPAVYHGHREMELAFTELFGGFPRSFYDAYRESWPLEPGHETRRALYNVYPLLVHVNLFGGGYVKQLMGNVERYL